MSEGLLLDSVRRSGDPADRILAAAPHQSGGSRMDTRLGAAGLIGGVIGSMMDDR